MTAKTYGLVGTGARGLNMFALPLARDLGGAARLAAVCDPNPIRLKYAAEQLPPEVRTYTDFDAMMSETQPDGVIIASPDATHADYVIRSLKAGKRVYCEKPLCVTAAQCRAVLRAARRSSGRCFVTHNMRYDAASQAIRAVVKEGRLGTVTFMQFDETLDRAHGADYFRRWHRSRSRSGSLLIHKASHHFDLLNWWAGSKPQTVQAIGALRFYGREGPFRHARCRGCPHASRCEFHMDLAASDAYRRLYLEAEAADGYLRDGCVFDESIDIFDQMSVLIQYENGLQVSYNLTAFSPYESQRCVIEGTRGRLEYFNVYDTSWVSGRTPLYLSSPEGGETLKLFLPDRRTEAVPIRRAAGGHGGADPQLRQEFFGSPWDAPPSERMASLEEAAQAVLIGAAAARSIDTGKPVNVQALLRRG